MKLISVIICAYNMEDYLDECIQSCLIPSKDKVEVLVMNDGSKDKTSEIAHKYQDAYPGIVVAVDKENGGWGSNINMAVKMATGKYVKVLDADDWFGQEDFETFVNALETDEADAVASRHYTELGDESELSQPGWKDRVGTTVTLNDIEEPLLFPIWDIAFKADLAKAHHVDLPHHTLYTDSLFIYHLLPYVGKMTFSEASPYHYRLGREGQSVEIASRIKHYQDYMRMITRMIDEYGTYENLPNKPHVLCRFKNAYYHVYQTLVLAQGQVEDNTMTLLKGLDSRMKKEYPDLYTATNESSLLSILRKSHYKGVGLAKKYLAKKGLWSIVR